MKKIIYLLGTILLFGLASCDKTTTEGETGATDPGEKEPVGIEGTATLSLFGVSDLDLETRAALNGEKAVWSQGDRFGLYDQVGRKITGHTMTVGQGNATEAIPFTGKISDTDADRKIYAAYPYVADYPMTDLSRYPVSISAEQSVDSPDDYTGYGKYLTAVAYTAMTGNPGAETPLSLNFQHVAAIWDINIGNADGYAISSVQVGTDPNGNSPISTPFVTAATIDLKKDYTKEKLTIVPTAYSATVTTSFTTAQSGPTVKARIFLLPMTTIRSSGGTDLRITITLGDGSKFNAAWPNARAEFAAGKVYKSALVLEFQEEPGSGSLEDFKEDTDNI